MLQPRRLPSSLLRAFNPINSLRPSVPCIRYTSRWNPAHPQPRTKPPKRIPPELPRDPKDYIPGWLEYKETLLRKCVSQEEIEVINELTPQEAEFLMNPDKTDETITSSRTVPVNPNYFSGQPVIEQRLQDVEKVYEKYKHLPKGPSHVWAQRQWSNAQVVSNEELDMTAGIFDQKSLRGRTKRAMVTIGKELNKIHPVLMPPELKKWLDKFAPLKYDGSAGARQRRMLDKYQRSRGNGKRKTARAKVQIVPGEGNVYVNGKLAADFFTRTKDVENVIWPLQSLNALGQYNVWVSTWGGGTTGQSEACKLAVARAMLAHDETGTLNMYRRVLRKAGCLKTDGRQVERKKHGHIKARKMPTWVKR